MPIYDEPIIGLRFTERFLSQRVQSDVGLSATGLDRPFPVIAWHKSIVIKMQNPGWGLPGGGYRCQLSWCNKVISDRAYRGMKRPLGGIRKATIFANIEPMIFCTLPMGSHDQGLLNLVDKFLMGVWDNDIRPDET